MVVLLELVLYSDCSAIYKVEPEGGIALQSFYSQVTDAGNDVHLLGNGICDTRHESYSPIKERSCLSDRHQSFAKEMEIAYTRERIAVIRIKAPGEGTAATTYGKVQTQRRILIELITEL